MVLKTATAHNPARERDGPRPTTVVVAFSHEYGFILLWYMYGHTYSKGMDQPGKVANPARGQLIRENEYFPVRVRA